MRRIIVFTIVISLFIQFQSIADNLERFSLIPKELSSIVTYQINNTQELITPPYEKLNYIPDEMIIGLRESDDATLQYIEKLGFEILDIYEMRNLILVSFDEDNPFIDKIVKNLLKNNKIRYAEPNYIVYTMTVPNDTLYPSQYGLKHVEAPSAWDITTGGDIVVSIVDTGGYWNHKDLIDNLWVNKLEDINGNGLYDEEDLNGKDDDNNGYIDDVIGYNFAANSPDVFKGAGNAHGTHTSGIVGATGNNDIGVSGVMWKVKLMRAPFIGGMSGSTYDAIKAIDYSVKNKAKVINASWGGHGYSEALYESIADAGKAGIIFVAAAGNSAYNIDRFPLYPAAYDLPNIITVAATNELGRKAVFSNFGKISVDVAAPGVNYVSTIPYNAYSPLTGTSMAAPVVSGGVGLLLSQNPNLSIETIKRILIETCTPERSLNDKVACGGIVNLKKAIDCVLNNGVCK